MGSWKSEIDYSPRYKEGYSDRVKYAMRQHQALNGGICILCEENQAEEMHHSSYGADTFGINWFPVCISCHKGRCHNKKNWVSLRGQESVFGNRNTDEFHSLLRERWKEVNRKRRK